MTLLLESAIRAFDVDEARLRSPSSANLERTGAVDFSLETVYSYASHYESLRHEDNPDWVCLPLHEPDGPELTDEYVAYTDHDLHEEIVIFADGDGEDFLSVEEFARTHLARRLRFWHPDYLPEEYPGYYQSPLDDREDPVRSVDPEEFFADLQTHVDEERKAQREMRREELADTDPATVYADGGDAIPTLRSRGGGAGSAHTFEIEVGAIDGVDERSTRQRRFVSSEFGIYPDDDVLLVPPSYDSAPDEFPLIATVETLGNKRVELAVDWTDVERRRSVERYLARERVGFGVSKLLNPLPYERRREAIDQLRSDEQFRRVLTGRRPMRFTNPRVARSDPQDPDLNQEQHSAVKHALMAESLFCIHGPPGTGKTRTLVEVVRRAVDAGDRVLVCADSNQAVDNVLVGDSTGSELDPGSLHAYGQHGTAEFEIARRNVRRSTRDEVKEWYGDARGGTDVVVATNGSAARVDGRFDLVVIDEATQATCATTAIPLSKADTAVLAGDHQQLPPFSRSETPPESAYGFSLFEHLYADGGVFEDVGIQLRSQYRMHRDIAYFPNRRFYDKSLGTAVDSDPLDEWPPILGYDIGGTATTDGTSYRNEDEAALIGHLVDRLLDEGVSETDIGVITPYAAQVRAIRDRLDGRAPSQGIDVDTIDSFQGSERTIVLISLVRSNADGQIGFLGRPGDGPRRLNVAMTRARRLCVLVGDWTTLQTSPPHEAHCTDLYRDLYKHLTDTGRMRAMDPDLLPS